MKQSFSGPIDDEILLSWFKENAEDISFIGFGGEFPTQVEHFEKETRNFIADLDPRKQFHDPENAEILMNLWKNLLGDAIIFLKSKDEREFYHDGEIFGVENIHKILITFKNYEKMLYGAIGHYRDHVAHVFRVFLLGEFLIRQTFGFENIFVHYGLEMNIFDNNNKTPPVITITPQEKEAMWCIISLTHDIGYALEDIDKINENIREMIKKFGKVNIQELSYLFPPQKHAIDEFVLRFISSNLVKDGGKKQGFWTHLQSKYYLKFSRACEKLDHGIISCTVLMRELVFFLESDYLLDTVKPLDIGEARQFLIRQTILRSIAAHNCEDIYHLSGRNFPFLLMFFDEMQQWGRPKMEDIFKEAGIPIEIIYLNKFVDFGKQGLEVSYSAIFEKHDESKKEAERSTKSIRDYFRRKTKKYIRVLRSAVDGQHREISLEFIVEDKISEILDGIHEYKFILRQPKSGSRKLEPELYIDNNKVISLSKVNEIFNSMDMEGDIQR